MGIRRPDQRRDHGLRRGGRCDRRPDLDAAGPRGVAGRRGRRAAGRRRGGRHGGRGGDGPRPSGGQAQDRRHAADRCRRLRRDPIFLRSGGRRDRVGGPGQDRLPGRAGPADPAGMAGGRHRRRGCRLGNRQGRPWPALGLPGDRDAGHLRDHHRDPQERGLAEPRRQERDRPAPPRALRGAASAGAVVHRPRRALGAGPGAVLGRRRQGHVRGAVRHRAADPLCAGTAGAGLALGPDDARDPRQPRCGGGDGQERQEAAPAGVRARLGRRRDRRSHADHARRTVHAGQLPAAALHLPDLGDGDRGRLGKQHRLDPRRIPGVVRLGRGGTGGCLADADPFGRAARRQCAVGPPAGCRAAPAAFPDGTDPAGGAAVQPPWPDPRTVPLRGAARISAAPTPTHKVITSAIGKALPSKYCADR